MFGSDCTNFVFTPGKLTTILDAQAGSSGKGKIGSFVTEHADNWQFCCNTFMPQAGHWIRLDDGREFFYQTFNSCAYNHGKFEKMYIGPGACIELAAFWRELEENKVPPEKIGISPVAAILQDRDGAYERGTMSFDGVPRQYESLHRFDGGYLAKTGSTAHGCGANRARRVMRRPEAKYARDIPELAPLLCDVPTEIMSRLDRGQAGLLEIAQGFQLSYLLPQFFPHTTSRNCTVAAGLDDLMVPPKYAGNVILNARTFPIRINNNKYVDKKTGKHLTWQEFNDHYLDCAGMVDVDVKAAMNDLVEIVQGDSGPPYFDQVEITWDDLTRTSGSPVPLMEMTSVTKLPRRVFTFSLHNLMQAIMHNDTGHQTFLSLNFTNYVDHLMSGRRGLCWTGGQLVTDAMRDWLDNHIGDNPLVDCRFLGTGPKTDDMILCYE